MKTMKSHPNWEVFELRSLTTPFNRAATAKEIHNLIGYLEDILIKCIGDIALNSDNEGFLIDWAPNAQLTQVVNNFLGEQRLFECVKNREIREEVFEGVTQHFTSYLNFSNRAFRNHSKYTILDQHIEDRLLQHTIEQAINFCDIKTVILADDIPLAALQAGLGYFEEEDLLLNGPQFSKYVSAYMPKILLLTFFLN